MKSSVVAPGSPLSGGASFRVSGTAYTLCNLRRCEMELLGRHAAILVEQQYQELEVWYPYYRLCEAGCQVVTVGPEAGKTYPSKLGYPVKADKAAGDCSPDEFDLLVIPGGF